MEDRKIRVAITHGDTNGIGYELIFKTFAEPDILELFTPIIYGSPKVAAYHRNVLGMEANFSIIADASEAKDGRVNLLTCFDDEVKVELGVPTEESGRAAVAALDRAVGDFKQGLFDVLVTAPVGDGALESNGVKFRDQQAFVEACGSDRGKGMRMFVNDGLRMALATDGLPLKDVAAAITPDLLEQRITLLYDTLQRDFRLSAPRVAVLSLNPGAQDSMGKEEEDTIAPVVARLADKGMSVFGPYAAAELFSGNIYDSFDGILAMYNDQGVAPFKALESSEGVCFLAGLPVVCVTPEVGENFSIAGRGVASPDALRKAIWLAVDIFRNRQEYDEPLANPLKKLYRERHDEGEKVRFAIPRKHENAIRERLPRGPRPNGAQPPRHYSAQPAAEVSAPSEAATASQPEASSAQPVTTAAAQQETASSAQTETPVAAQSAPAPSQTQPAPAPSAPGQLAAEAPAQE